MSLTHDSLCLLPRSFFFHDEGDLIQALSFVDVGSKGDGTVAPDGILLFNRSLGEWCHFLDFTLLYLRQSHIFKPEQQEAFFFNCFSSIPSRPRRNCDWKLKEIGGRDGEVTEVSLNYAAIGTRIINCHNKILRLHMLGGWDSIICFHSTST